MKLSEAKESCACIYRLSFPDGKIYVGQTKNFGERMRLYRKKAGAKDLHSINGVIAKFGIKNVDVDIICRIGGLSEIEERLCLNVLEIHYIKELGSLMPDGYNLSLGGEIFGLSPEMFSLSSDEVLNYYKGGSKPVLEYDTSGAFVREYKSISECAYFLGVKEDTVRVYLTKSKFLHGKHLLRKKRGSEIPLNVSVQDVELVRKIKKVYIKKEIEVEKEKKVYKEVIVERPKYERTAPCVLYDINGDLIGVYKHKSDAERVAGFRSTVPYGRYRNGYILFREGESVPEKIEPMEEMLGYILGDYYKPLDQCEKRPPVVVCKRNVEHRKIKVVQTVNQYNLGGVLIAEHASVRDASRDTGIPYSGIYACVMGKTAKSHGFIWEFA